MPPKRSPTAKRQTKINFSSSPANSNKRKLIELSDDSDTGLPTPKKSFRSTIDTPPSGEVKRGMRMGMPVSTNRRGMFGSSDVEIESDSISSDSSDESEQVPVHRKKSKRLRRQSPQRQEVVSDEQESETSERVSPIRRKSTKERRRLRTRQQVESDEEEIEAPEQASPIYNRSTRKQRQPPAEQPESQEEERDEDTENPGRQRNNNKMDRQEHDDLQEDLDFLRSSPPATTRKGGAKPMNERQKALAALKQKRATAAGEPPSSASRGRKRAVVLSDSDNESDSDLEIINEEQNVEEVEDEEVEEVEHHHDTNAFDMFQEDVNDEDFIDDNPDDLLGEPAELPAQFSSLGRAKPRELFKFAVAWMVQKKINPAFSTDDEIYSIAFRKLDDEVSGLASSKYSSSVWTPDFTRALRARPDIMIDEIGRQMKDITLPHCEACNRKTHPATFNITFTGKPYHRETLEPLAEDSDSESDSDVSSTSDSEEDLNGEKRTYDAQGGLLPPESKVFTLGSTCKANSQMAHTLHHWRYHLNSWVVDYLVRKGHCTPEKLVERDGWSVKKRSKLANKIVKAMDKEGEIKKLHRLYKEQVDFAFEAKTEYKQGWGKR